VKIKENAGSVSSFSRRRCRIRSLQSAAGKKQPQQLASQPAAVSAASQGAQQPAAAQWQNANVKKPH
jgi:hypothetical protein